MDFYKRKTFSLLLLFCCIGVLSVFLSSFFYFFYPLYTKAEYWIPEMMEAKNKRAQTIDSSKVIIASGSNCLFGVSTPVLEEKIHKKVLNLSLHAAMPLEFYAYLIKKYAKSGDFVILPLEFEYYARGEKPSDWEVTQFSTWGKDYLSLFSEQKRFEIFKQALLTYPVRYPNILKKFPVRNLDQVHFSNPDAILSKHAYIAEYSNRYGEFCIDVMSALSEKQSFDYVDKSFKLSNAFKKTIINLNDYLKSNGVTMLVTLPVSVKCDTFNMDSPADHAKVVGLFSELNMLGIKTFGNPFFYNLDRKFFWDSRYHTNAKGAILRTLFLADDFVSFYHGASGNSEPNSSYMLGKEAEASEIFDRYFELGYIEGGH